MSSEAQMAANRANAKLSTGPQTAEGKNKVSLNAVKTGLTGRTVLLPGDDVEAYRLHVERTIAELEPLTGRERGIVHSIADTDWRLLRIPVLEMGIYALGRRQLADQFADETDTAVRNALIEVQVYLNYEKQLKNLALQERRLRAQHLADHAELNRLQLRRLKEIDDAAKHYNNCQKTGEKFVVEEFGLEITDEEVEARAAEYREQYRAEVEYMHSRNNAFKPLPRKDAA
jgi:hypothetical protein